MRERERNDADDVFGREQEERIERELAALQQRIEAQSTLHHAHRPTPNNRSNANATASATSTYTADAADAADTGTSSPAPLTFPLPGSASEAFLIHRDQEQASVI